MWYDINYWDKYHSRAWDNEVNINFIHGNYPYVKNLSVYSVLFKHYSTNDRLQNVSKMTSCKSLVVSLADRSTAVHLSRVSAFTVLSTPGSMKSLPEKSV